MNNNEETRECPLDFTPMLFDEENCWWICPRCGYVGHDDELCSRKERSH